MADIEALEASVKEKVADGRCGACGKNEWNAATSTYALMAIGGGGAQLEGGTRFIHSFAGTAAMSECTPRTTSRDLEKASNTLS
jgi:hypothetical protein